MKQNKRIILIGNTTTSVLGFRSDLLKELVAQDNNVYVFVSEVIVDDLVKIESLGVIPIVYKLNRGGINPFVDILSIFILLKLIRKVQPDLVFSYFAKPVIYGAIAAKLARVPRVIGMIEGLGYPFTDQPEGISNKLRFIRIIQVYLYKLSIPLLDKIIFLNSDDPIDLLTRFNIKSKQIEILGGIGLDLGTYSYHPVEINKVIRFLFIGRLLREKGIHEFIAAAEIVKNLYPNTVFTVLGAIDYKNPGALSQERLNSYIDKNLIEYIGHVSNVKDWIIKSHVFVLPSYYREGVPRSTQEAMAIGRPVITTNVPGCRETVIDGVNGFLVPKWNVEILAEKMIFLVNNPDKIKDMGKSSREIAEEKFDSKKVNQKMLQILFN